MLKDEFEAQTIPLEGMQQACHLDNHCLIPSNKLQTRIKGTGSTSIILHRKQHSFKMLLGMSHLSEIQISQE